MFSVDLTKTNQPFTSFIKLIDPNEMRYPTQQTQPKCYKPQFFVTEYFSGKEPACVASVSVLGSTSDSQLAGSTTNSGITDQICVSALAFQHDMSKLTGPHSKVEEDRTSCQNNVFKNYRHHDRVGVNNLKIKRLVTCATNRQTRLSTSVT